MPDSCGCLPGHGPAPLCPLHGKVSLPQRLNDAEVRSVLLSAAEVEAKQAWLLAEAQARLRFKVMSEADEHGKRSNSRDRDAEVIVEQNNPDTALGKAWMAYNKARTEAALAKVEAKKLDRQHWEEVRRQ